jgi:hypothetical protein
MLREVRVGQFDDYFAVEIAVSGEVNNSHPSRVETGGHHVPAAGQFQPDPI